LFRGLIASITKCIIAPPLPPVNKYYKVVIAGKGVLFVFHFYSFRLGFVGSKGLTRKMFVVLSHKQRKEEFSNGLRIGEKLKSLFCLFEITTSTSLKKVRS